LIVAVPARAQVERRPKTVLASMLTVLYPLMVTGALQR